MTTANKPRPQAVAHNKAARKKLGVRSIPSYHKPKPGARLTPRQRRQLEDAGRDIHGNKLPEPSLAIQSHTYDLPKVIFEDSIAEGNGTPIELQIDDVKTIEAMSLETFIALKNEAKQKKRGFKKFCEREGWTLLAGADQNDAKNWHREI